MMVIRHAVTWGNIQPEGKGPNVGVSLVCSGSSRENRAIGVDGAGRWLEMRSESVTGTLAFPEWEQGSLLGFEQRNDGI